MKFGIFLLMQSPDMLPSSEIYQNAIEQVRLADDLGCDYVVAAEHHFSSYGFLPNPLMLISTLAQHTKRGRFSPAVVVLPLRNPIQIAEEIAMLDHITNGRLEVVLLGVGGLMIRTGMRCTTEQVTREHGTQS